ncbi:MAG TPA: hypothetical protein VGW78_03955 [Candidatus Babeliales bacterium]|nr:hypothetical protein [Candidatus Babeliales bacterium]
MNRYTILIVCSVVSVVLYGENNTYIGKTSTELRQEAEKMQQEAKKLSAAAQAEQERIKNLEQARITYKQNLAAVSTKSLERIEDAILFARDKAIEDFQRCINQKKIEQECTIDQDRLKRREENLNVIERAKTLPGSFGKIVAQEMFSETPGKHHVDLPKIEDTDSFYLYRKYIREAKRGDYDRYETFQFAQRDIKEVTAHALDDLCTKGIARNRAEAYDILGLPRPKGWIARTYETIFGKSNEFEPSFERSFYKNFVQQFIGDPNKPWAPYKPKK